ncbi:hydrogenase maturation protease [Desulfopila sp. IMCC35008]|uniref:hydrogenase maturation protease n=1 Tax=Desulfopila sp. IMCC35008 TaxID=2653858 RepID=UPI0013D79331|nr:hydrogenase maturation protease [Desulfopila sp. IMCC35008]
MDTLIICIGNALAADDGAGADVFEELKRAGLPEGARLCFLGLGGLDLLDELAGEDQLIVVDAVQLGGPVGTVHVLDWHAIPVMGPRPVSGHGIGVREAIEVGRRLYPERVPGHIVLVGIEGAVFDQLGIPLSDEVRQAVPRAVNTIIKLVSNSAGDEDQS